MCSPNGSRGLSPPTRGNRPSRVQNHERQGSIPAHAGEPASTAPRIGKRRVYPRPRGGTVSEMAIPTTTEGLSPPTRGNHSGGRRDNREQGSIPAHAGEPVPVTDRWDEVSVYPRPRGGTGFSGENLSRKKGLSPPTRGNRHDADPIYSWERSIPAHAGEPGEGLAGGGTSGVYPRPRGGTARTRKPVLPADGLSPPTRGNRGIPGGHEDRHGSIPAHAGEPWMVSSESGAPRVYPRPRGGTLAERDSRLSVRGLSPPTRGNHHKARRQDTALGSIPAHAGEPKRPVR